MLFALLLLISGAMYGQATRSINAAPELTVYPDALTGFNYTYGNGPSDPPKSFTVSGSNLPDEVTASVSNSYFEICLDGGEYSPNLTFTPVSGNLQNTTVFVRMVRDLNPDDYTSSITFEPDLSATVTLSGSVSAIGTVEAPVFSPAQGEYNAAQEVSINCDTEEATIFYSTDSENGPWSSYTGAITVNENMTIWAYATKEGYNDSPVSSANYIINIPTLTVTPDQLSGFNYTYGGGPSGNQVVIVTGSNLTENVNVYVTESANSFEVCETATGLFLSSISLNPNTGSLNDTVYVRMKAGLPVGNNYIGTIDVTCGPDLSATVNLSGSVNPDTVATPTFSKDTGTYQGPLTVSINCATEGATIRYTTDGTDPTQSSQIYFTPLNIVQNTTIKAKAWKNDYQTSATASATYTVTYTISVTADPSNGGSVMQSGNGTYTYGDTPTLTAEANEAGGYHFVNWTKNDTVVSNETSFSPTIIGNDSYVAHFELNSYIIRVSADPDNGGSPYIGNNSGTTEVIYTHGQQCTVHANPADGFTFANWKENNQVVQGASANYTFTVTNDRNLVAHYTQDSYIITVSAVPPEGGVLTGNGAYHYDESCTVTAQANNGYTFVNWTENDSVVSNYASYQFTVTGDRTLVAHFVEQAPNTYTINVSPNQSSGGAPYVGNIPGTTQGTFTDGQSCTVHANPSGGYNFINWTENGTQVSTDANYTFTVHANRNLVANFQAQTYTINVSANPTNGGSPYVGNTPGITHKNYTYGQSCTVHANPSSDYSFANWTENGTQVSTDANYTFTVTTNRNLVAHFTQQQYTIIVLADPPQGGMVEGNGTFPAGSTTTLTACANEGYDFEHWQDGNTQNPRTITVNGNATYIATFKQDEYTITTKVTPENSGTVDGGGPGFHYGDRTILTANANNGYIFKQWQDDNTDNPRQITVICDSTYIAEFDERKYTITVKANNDDWGTVTGSGEFSYGEIIEIEAIHNFGYDFMGWDDGVLDNPRQITVTCDSTFVAIFDVVGSTYYNVTATVDPVGAGRVTGAGTYPANTDTILMATAYIGYTFSHWQDNITDNPRRITVNESMSFTAYFTPKQYTINVSANPPEGGTVGGGGTYNYGVTCSLTAIPNLGYTFTSWMNSDSIIVNTTDTIYRFAVREDASYFANFSKAPITYYEIKAQVSPANAGMVTGAGMHPAGDTITLEAEAYLGYRFAHWQDGNTDNPRTIIVTGPAIYIATFTQNNYVITTNISPIGAGTVTGGGTYHYEDQATLTAMANENYIFTNWTEDDDVVSTNVTYTFTVTGDRILVANFEEISCIENIQEIVAKKHAIENNDTIILLLIYPNPNNENYTYQWLYSDKENEGYTELSGATGQYYYEKGGLDEGFYKVRIIKDADCSAETKSYHVENNGKHLRIYPNPSCRGSNIIVVNDSDGPAQLAIYSADGRLLHTQTMTGNQASVNIILPQGVYVAYLTNSDGYTKVGKLIIQ